MFVLMADNVVIQTQPNAEDGFVETDKNPICGQIEKDGLFKDPKALPITSKKRDDALKILGVKFKGVMCSAEAEDMWGLASIKDFIEAGNSTKFVFKNGNTLTLTPDNIAAFQAIWIPFRLEFFK